MIRRIIKWTLGLAVVSLAVVFFVLPMLANTEQGRKHLEKVLTRALSRTVTIEELDVGWFLTSVDVSGLRIANPDGFPEGYMVEADVLNMDASLSDLIGGNLVSGITSEGLRLHIIKKNGKSNLEGFGSSKKGEKKEGGEVPRMDLSMDLTNGHLIVEDLDKNERLEVSGVGTQARLRNDDVGTTAHLTITVASVDNKTLRIRDLVLNAKLEGEFMQIDELSAILPGRGTLEGTGRMRVRNGDTWELHLKMNDVGLDGDMMPFVASVYPIAASAGGQVDGTMNASFDVTGRGLSWEAAKPTLAGNGQVTIANLRLPKESIVAGLVALAGGKSTDLSLNTAGAQFKIADGWVNFNRLSAAGKEARYDFAGRVSLDSSLELQYDLMPLVKQFGGGSTYREAAKYVDAIPVRIVGTADKPKLKAPDLKQLARGAVGKGLGGILDKIK